MTTELHHGLQNYEYDEVDIDAIEDISSQMNLSAVDPNLNVTSAPEQLDVPMEQASSVHQHQKTEGIVLFRQQSSDQERLTELMPVEYQQILINEAGDSFCHGDEFYASEVSVSAGVSSLTECTTGPATVTLFRPHLQQQQQQLHIVGDSRDPLAARLLRELYSGDVDTTSSSKAANDGFVKETSKAPQTIRLSLPPMESDASTNAPNVPMIEPLPLKTQVQMPAFDLVSPSTDSVETESGFPFKEDSSEDSASSVDTMVNGDRDAEIEQMASYIRSVIEKRGSKPDNMSAKLKVHEVIIVILLNANYGDRSRDLQRILAFCDETGREVAGEGRHFKTLDTETMGRLWQKIKGNKKANYDTFARAMRVRRERAEGFFSYLDAGKGKKKRIYRFGDRSMVEMSRFKRALKQISRPQSCSY